jgi:hypothetical protein
MDSAAETKWWNTLKPKIENRRTAGESRFATDKSGDELPHSKVPSKIQNPGGWLLRAENDLTIRRTGS